MTTIKNQETLEEKLERNFDLLNHYPITKKELVDFIHYEIAQALAEHDRKLLEKLQHAFEWHVGVCMVKNIKSEQQNELVYNKKHVDKIIIDLLKPDREA